MIRQHEGRIADVSCSTDKTRRATRGWDKPNRIWHRDGERLRSHPANVRFSRLWVIGWQAILTACFLSTVLQAGSPTGRRTHVSVVDGRWHINDHVTYSGTRAEGLLLNVRMVNSVFEDQHRADFDAEANTDRFLAQVPDYAAHGVRAFTICLQGGMPGYEGALNSAFQPDGSLRESYLKRVRRVIDTCDQHGLVVVLGCFYQRQDQVLQDEAAVRRGLVNVVDWIVRNGFQNVVLEIANEFDHRGFDYSILRSVEGELELIRLAKSTAPVCSSRPAAWATDAIRKDWPWRQTFC